MTFDEAMSAAQSGATVKRSAWKYGTRVHVPTSYPVIFDETGYKVVKFLSEYGLDGAVPLALRQEDIDATDWEIVSE